MNRDLAKAKKDGYRVVYIDETCFTRKTCPDTEWSLPKENMAVDTAMLDEPTLALLAGVSKEKGTEHFQIFESSVNVDKFLEYLATWPISDRPTARTRSRSSWTTCRRTHRRDPRRP